MVLPEKERIRSPGTALSGAMRFSQQGITAVTFTAAPAAANARTLAQKAGVEMPIAQAAYEVLYEGRDVHAVVTGLMGRAKRSERDESYL